jgi:hypothetical protein
MFSTLAAASSSARTALRSAHVPARLPLKPVHPVRPLRQLHTSRPSHAQYERFDRGFSGPTGPSGRPDFKTFLRRRFGSDRALYIYGIGVGGAGLYYVVQYDLHSAE